jgi:NitT/TauT family transport system ATP-binding protein
MSKNGDVVGPTGVVTDFHAMAKVSVGQILGLVEAIDEVGGTADVATISQEVDMDLDRLGPILSAAEFLGLVAIEDGDVRMTDLSRKLLHANVRQRKAILREIIEDIPVFRQVMDMVRKAGGSLARHEVHQAITDRVGGHQADDLFRALVYWGRYVELVQYDSETEQLTLRTPSKLA